MSANCFKYVKISGISFIMPNNIKHSVDEYLEYFDNDIKKLTRAKKIIGYGNTYSSPNGITTVDLCETAANDLIQNLNINKNTIDAVIFISQSPDYIAPSSASVLHGRLDLPETCSAFDMNQGCTGWVYGLWTASSLVESGACQKVLLLAGDNVVDAEDIGNASNKVNSLIFSSAGCATLIERSTTENPLYFLIGSRGKEFEQIIMPAGGARLKIDKQILDTTIEDKNGNLWNLNSTFMDGLGVFNFSINDIPEHVNQLMNYSGSSIKDIDFFAIHQANKQIVKNIASLLNIPADKYSAETFTNYGNMSGVASISNLIDMYGQQLQTEYKKTAVISFGIGLSWASVVMNIGNIYCSGIKMHTFKDYKTKNDTINYWINKIKNYSGS